MRCRQCNREYDREYVIEICGLEFAAKGFCTNICYTNYQIDYLASQLAFYAHKVTGEVVSVQEWKERAKKEGK